MKFIVLGLDADLDDRRNEHQIYNISLFESVVLFYVFHLIIVYSFA